MVSKPVALFAVLLCAGASAADDPCAGMVRETEEAQRDVLRWPANSMRAKALRERADELERKARTCLQGEAIMAAVRRRAEHAAAERRRIAEDERERRERAATRERDPQWMRPALSAMVCHLDAVTRSTQRELDDHLAHPTTDSDYNATAYGLRDRVRESAEQVRDMRQRLKNARWVALPCVGEVARVVSCIERRGAPQCQSERIAGLLDLLGPVAQIESDADIADVSGL